MHHYSQTNVSSSYLQAWNSALQTLITAISPDAKTNAGKFVYSIIITLLGMLITALVIKFRKPGKSKLYFIRTYIEGINIVVAYCMVSAWSTATSSTLTSASLNLGIFALVALGITFATALIIFLLPFQGFSGSYGRRQVEHLIEEIAANVVAMGWSNLVFASVKTRPPLYHVFFVCVGISVLGWLMVWCFDSYDRRQAAAGSSWAVNHKRAAVHMFGVSVGVVLGSAWAAFGNCLFLSMYESMNSEYAVLAFVLFPLIVTFTFFVVVFVVMRFHWKELLMSTYNHMGTAAGAPYQNHEDTELAVRDSEVARAGSVII